MGVFLGWGSWPTFGTKCNNTFGLWCFICWSLPSSLVTLTEITVINYTGRAHRDERKFHPISTVWLFSTYVWRVIVHLCMNVRVLLCEYLQRLKEVSSKPCSASSALICRRTCLWRAGLGLCFCWTYSPERAEEGRKGQSFTLVHLFLCSVKSLLCYLKGLFWVIATLSLKTCFPWGAATHETKTKKANSDKKKTKGLVGLSVMNAVWFHCSKAHISSNTVWL